MESVNSIEKLAAKYANDDDPLAALSKELRDAVDQFVEDLVHFEPYRLIEVARMAYLPWTRPGLVKPHAEATAAHVELLALIALAAAKHPSNHVYPAVQLQEMSGFVHAASERLNHLLELSHLRAIASSDASNKLAMIELLIRGSQTLVRHTSYSDMVEETLVQLFDSDTAVETSLKTELGFNAAEALAVLDACHEMQQIQLNDRLQSFFDTPVPDMTDHEDTSRYRLAFGAAFEPDTATAAVSQKSLIDHFGFPENLVTAVVNRFRLDLTAHTPTDVVEAFMSGSNPMRTTPLIVASDGRHLLPHNTLTVDAVKESLEEHLKTSDAWNRYVKHRGELLETRTHRALEKIIPSAVFRNGFNYFVPANQVERDSHNPESYTKRVEADHLVVLDDAAFIIEDKAVALSALSKGGKTNRIRTDLTGIITKAAEQADRLRKLIHHDGGVLIEGEGWVDLSKVREIHTMAVSLDDLMSVTTATSELVRAELLDPESIPWTVSLHDLELIAKLVQRPAEFLLYLRRRTNPQATLMFSASDELDLFLFFFEDGLWIEPDPDKTREIFGWLGTPTTAERRRYREQRPAFITSRTDVLDAWYYSTRTPGSPMTRIPTMVASPLASLIDDLSERRTFGWMSIGATLLGMATASQHKMAGIPRDLLAAPRPDGQGRSLTMPVTGAGSLPEAWLFIWGTRPIGRDTIADEVHWRKYARIKKYQLGIPRAAIFIYDEGSRGLADVYYDGSSEELPEDLQHLVSALRAPTSFSGPLHPNAKQRSERNRAKKRRK